MNKKKKPTKLELDNHGNQLNQNNKEFKGCKPQKEVRQYVHKMQKKYHKPIKGIIPILQRETAQKGELIKKGDIVSLTQSAIAKCDNNN